MSLGAGITVALAVAASAAGWWLLAAIGTAAVFAGAAHRALTRRGPRAGDGGSAGGTGLGDDRVGCGLRAAARLGMLVVFATVFGAHVTVGTGSGPAGAGLPGVPGLVAAGFAVAAVVVEALGLRPARPALRWVTGVLLVAAAAFVALCVAIPPASPIGAGRGAGPTPAGFVLAVVVFLPLFAGMRPGRLAVAAGAALAVAMAALYQLGPVRLGLSPTSLRDALTAADARVMIPALTAVVVLATGVAALRAAGQAREALSALAPGPVGATVVCGAVAAVLAAVLGPATALLSAAALVVAETVHGLLRRPPRRPS